MYRVTQQCMTLCPARSCNLLVVTSQQMQLTVWDNGNDMPHARRHKLQRFRLEWPYCPFRILCFISNLIKSIRFQLFSIHRWSSIDHSKYTATEVIFICGLTLLQEKNYELNLKQHGLLYLF